MPLLLMFHFHNGDHQWVLFGYHSARCFSTAPARQWSTAVYRPTFYITAGGAAIWRNGSEYNPAILVLG